MRGRTALALAFGCVPAFAPAAQAGRAECGLSIHDWCASSPGDRCGIHPDVTSCHADPACYGMPYGGESFVACKLDERGFGLNCPTVGCTSRPAHAR